MLSKNELSQDEIHALKIPIVQEMILDKLHRAGYSHDFIPGGCTNYTRQSRGDQLCCPLYDYCTGLSLDDELPCVLTDAESMQVNLMYKYQMRRQSGRKYRVHQRPGSYGVKNSQSKMTPDTVRAVRRLHGEGISQRELGRRYGVSQASIYGIVHRKTWSHVDDEEAA